MPRRCFLGCPSGSASHQHVFPNPKRFPEQFKKWVQIVGGKLNTSDDYAFYLKKNLCDRHFTIKDKNRCNRLNALAVPSLYVTTIDKIENSTPASHSTVVDMEEDPLKITEAAISNTRIIADVPSPQTPEGISCPSPIEDVPSPQAEEVIISCTSPIVDNSPKPPVAQQALHTGSDVLAGLNHTYSKFKFPENCNVAAPDSKFQVPVKTNVANCSARDLYKDNAFVPLSDYKCQQRQIRLLKQQVCALKRRCLSYKNRLAQALKPSAAFQKVTKNMTEPAKLFTKMQFTQTHKKPGGRRFSSEEKNFSVSLYKTSPQSYSFLAHCFTLPSIKTIRAILAQEKLEPYLTLDKNATLPTNKTLVQERLEPYLTLDKNSTSPVKITLKDMLPKDNFEPYLTVEQNCSLPFRITLKDILAHKQLAPYLPFKKNSTSPSKTREKEKPEPDRTLKKNSTSPSKTREKENPEPDRTLTKNSTSPSKTREKEKPEPDRTLKKKYTLPSKKALKGILAQEQLEPYLTFNKNSSIKTYIGKRKARTEDD